MRILDEQSDRWLDSVTLYLTPDEAEQLASYLEGLVEDPVGLHHAHLEEIDYEAMRVVREVTVAVYVDENMDTFGERFRRLIETDE
jgi:hypothetical protein